MGCSIIMECILLPELQVIHRSQIMSKFFKYGILALLAACPWPAFADDNSPAKPLEIGVVPYMTARTLVGSYEPIRLYLEKVLNRPVKIFTSSGFKPFFFNASRGDYDLVISAAHFARILQKEQKFAPMVRYSAGGRALLMTALDSPLKAIKDLRGQVIAVPDKLSLAAIVCLTYLRENGLQSDTDFQLLEVPSFASAILAVQKGDAKAAISAQAVLMQMPQELRESVRTVVDAGEYIPLVFLAHPRLGKKYSDLLNSELLKFANETLEGKQFLINTGFGAIIPASAKDMSSLDRYIAETKRLMEVTP